MNHIEAAKQALEALKFFGKYAPCPHNNADTRLGNGEIWAKCEDCGVTFPQNRWEAARKEATDFETAITSLRAAIEQMEKVEPVKYVEVKVEGAMGTPLTALYEPAQNYYTHPAPVPEGMFKLGDRVTKIKGSNWTGHVVGTYSTSLTPEGYAVESETEKGSVQIYPAAALRAAPKQEGE